MWSCHLRRRSGICRVTGCVDANWAHYHNHVNELGFSSLHSFTARRHVLHSSCFKKCRISTVVVAKYFKNVCMSFLHHRVSITFWHIDVMALLMVLKRIVWDGCCKVNLKPIKHLMAWYQHIIFILYPLFQISMPTNPANISCHYIFTGIELKLAIYIHVVWEFHESFKWYIVLLPCFIEAV